jgi:hypothetical protein
MVAREAFGTLIVLSRRANTAPETTSPATQRMITITTCFIVSGYSLEEMLITPLTLGRPKIAAGLQIEV